MRNTWQSRGGLGIFALTDIRTGHTIAATPNGVAMSRPWSSAVYLLAIVITCAVSVTAIPVAGAAPSSPNPSTNWNELKGVDAVSSSNAWAVGDYQSDGTGAYQTLVLHWNGTTWSQVSSPNPSSTANYLLGVSMLSSTNGWAVGEFFNGSLWNTLILHWNGSSWSQVSSPDPSTANNDLSGVSVVSSSNAWAVGTYYNTNTSASDTLILHWNGTKWSQKPSPSPSPYNYLYGVSAVSSSNAWAVGSDSTGGPGIPGSVAHTLVLHWNGTKWSMAKSPNPSSTSNALRGVSADSSSDAWAVGGYTNDASQVPDTLILHWNGRTWSKIGSPNPGSSDNYLSGVSALSSSDAWAVGSYYNGSVWNTLILHWNGSKWSKVMSPNPGTSVNNLFGVGAGSSSNAWAVGSLQSSGGLDTLVLRWKGTKWSQV